jgi:hypothetical protein
MERPFADPADDVKTIFGNQAEKGFEPSCFPDALEGDWHPGNAIASYRSVSERFRQGS